MIKLELPPCPVELTTQLQALKTTEFITSGKQKRVWDIDWLTDAVFDMAFGKCCYSEVRLGEESKNMEVEHFQPKSIYPNKVMEWGNLFPSLKKCNGKKRDLDVIKEPIINPFVDNPKEYFQLKGCRYYPLTKNETVAKRSIEKLALNDRETFVNRRFEISVETKKKLEDLRIDFDKIDDITIPVGRFRRLLQTGNREKEYSSLVSTTILTDQNYIEIKKLLEVRELWDAEFKALKCELEFCALI